MQLVVDGQVHVSLGNKVTASGRFVPIAVNTFNRGLCMTFPSSMAFLAGINWVACLVLLLMHFVLAQVAPFHELTFDLTDNVNMPWKLEWKW